MSEIKINRISPTPPAKRDPKHPPAIQKKKKDDSQQKKKQKQPSRPGRFDDYA